MIRGKKVEERGKGRENRRDGGEGRMEGGREGKRGGGKTQPPKDHPTGLVNPQVKQSAASPNIHCIPMFSKQVVTLASSIQQMTTSLELSQKESEMSSYHNSSEDVVHPRISLLNDSVFS